MAPAVPRFTLRQVLLLLVACGLLATIMASVSRNARQRRPSALAFSPDGKSLAVTFQGQRLQVLSTESGRRRLDDRISGFGNFGYLQACFADEQTLAVVRHLLAPDSKSEVVFWDLRDGRRSKQEWLETDGVGHPRMIAVPGGGRMAVLNAGLWTIDLWDLARGEKLGTIREAPEIISLSWGGDRLAAVTGNGDAGVWSIHGRRLHELAGANATQVALSPDGKRLAVLSPGASGGPRLRVWQLVGPAVRLAEFGLDGPHVEHVGFIDGGHRLLVVYADGRVQKWDWRTERPTRELHVGAPCRAFAVTADGGTLALADDGAIRLLETGSLSVVRTLWSDHTLFRIVLYSAALILWSVVWGRATRGAGPDPRAFAVADIRRPMKPLQSSRLAILRALLITALFGTGLAALVAWRLDETRTAWFCLTLVAGLIGFPLLVLLLSVAVAFVTQAVFHSPRLQLQRAAEIAGVPGRLGGFGPVTSWYAGPSQTEPHLKAEFQCLTERIRDLLPGVAVKQKPLLVLHFDRHHDLQAYLGRELPLAGVFHYFWIRQAVYCEPQALELLHDPRKLLRSLLSLYLLESAGLMRAPAWVVGVLEQHLIRDEYSPASLRVAHRRLRQGMDEGLLAEPDPFFAARLRDTWLPILRAEEGAAFRRSTAWSDIHRSLSEYFLGAAAPEARRQAFLSFVERLSRREPLESAFRACFRASFDEVLQQWRDWLADFADSAAAPPPPAVQEALTQHVLPRMANSRAAGPKRSRAVRAVGALGDPHTAASLVELLGVEPLRADVIWALRSVTGTPGGDDAARWREGWAARPPVEADAVRPSEPPPGVPVEAAGGVSPAGASAGSDEPVRVVAPQALASCWLFMFLGGCVAVVLGVALLFSSGIVWLPTFHFSLLTGVVAVAKGAGRHVRGLKKVWVMQLLNLMNCDLINVGLGLYIFARLRDPSVRNYRNASVSESP